MLYSQEVIHMGMILGFLVLWAVAVLLNRGQNEYKTEWIDEDKQGEAIRRADELASMRKTTPKQWQLPR